MKEITYQGRKFRIEEFEMTTGDKRLLMAIHIDEVGWVGFKICNSKSEVWNTLNNFTIDDLF